jgi:ribosomal protein S27AE
LKQISLENQDLKRYISIMAKIIKGTKTFASMQQQDITVETKKCPFCGGNAIGNKIVKYYCKKCNIKFKEASE